MPRATVLLLESDDLTVSRLETVLRDGNFEVISAPNFREAFQEIRAHAKNLALMILNFELATDDVDILARMRKLDFERPLPVVLLGDVPLAPEEVKQLALDSGYAGYLFKSMSDADLLSYVSQIALKDPERRFGKRVYHQSRALCTVREQHYAAEIYTLSEGGAFCRCKEPHPGLGMKGRLRFNAVLEGERVLDLAIEVLYHRTPDPQVMSIHPAGFAVRFVDVTDEDQKVLNALLDHLAAKDKRVETKS